MRISCGWSRPEERRCVLRLGTESDIEDESTGTGPRGFDAGTMAAVQGPREGVEDIVRAFDGVVVANDNSNSQVVIAGPDRRG